MLSDLKQAKSGSTLEGPKLGYDIQKHEAIILYKAVGISEKCVLFSICRHNGSQLFDMNQDAKGRDKHAEGIRHTSLPAARMLVTKTPLAFCLTILTLHLKIPCLQTRLTAVACR